MTIFRRFPHQRRLMAFKLLEVASGADGAGAWRFELRVVRPGGLT